MSKKTVKLVVESGNYYLIKVKANQPKLLKAIRETLKDGNPLYSYQDQEHPRGRIEKRQFQIYNSPEYVDPQWVGLKRIIYCRRSGQRKGKFYCKESYYMSNAQLDAREFAQGVRGHWSIENRCHWVKDVIQNDDGCGISSTMAASNLSLLKSLVMSIYRKNGYQSIKAATECFANKVNNMHKILRT